jgi:hypothetical protein
MKLQPLRISTGWKVSYNQFYEIDPLKGFENYFDASSLLVLKHHTLLKLIDVSWRPERELNGEYKVEVLNFQENFISRTNELDIHPNWEHPYLTFSTKSRLELVAKLEELMVQLPIYRDTRILKNRGVLDYPSETYRIQLEEKGLTKDILNQIINDGNSKIQNLVIDHKNINRDILLLFSKNGMSKKLINKANQKLNSKSITLCDFKKKQLLIALLQA